MYTCTTHMHVYIYIRTYIHTYVYLYIYMSISIYIYIYIYIYMYIYIHIHIYIYTFTYIYIYTHTHTHICTWQKWNGVGYFWMSLHLIALYRTCGDSEFFQIQSLPQFRVSRSKNSDAIPLRCIPLLSNKQQTLCSILFISFLRSVCIYTCTYTYVYMNLFLHARLHAFLPQSISFCLHQFHFVIILCKWMARPHPEGV